ncbi:hypothetical protein [Mycetocola sp. 2940]|uniref:hypothetical protein n=1 Tax=Mycetocola sp. 2940 TaxID=3156452 RepID=UPI003391C461
MTTQSTRPTDAPPPQAGTASVPRDADNRLVVHSGRKHPAHRMTRSAPDDQAGGSA